MGSLDVMIRRINTSRKDLNEIIERTLGKVKPTITTDMIGYKLENANPLDWIIYYGEAEALVQQLGATNYEIVIEYREINQSASDNKRP